jgi:hypothetical protein
MLIFLSLIPESPSVQRPSITMEYRRGNQVYQSERRSTRQAIGTQSIKSGHYPLHLCRMNRLDHALNYLHKGRSLQ